MYIQSSKKRNERSAIFCYSTSVYMIRWFHAMFDLLGFISTFLATLFAKMQKFLHLNQVAFALSLCLAGRNNNTHFLTPPCYLQCRQTLTMR